MINEIRVYEYGEWDKNRYYIEKNQEGFELIEQRFFNPEYLIWDCCDMDDIREKDLEIMWENGTEPDAIGYSDFDEENNIFPKED